MAEGKNDTGDYEAEIRDAIRQAAAAVTKLESEREEINSKIEAEISGLEAKGIGRRAFKIGRKWSQLDPEERTLEDEGVRMVKDALKPATDLLGDDVKEE